MNNVKLNIFVSLLSFEDAEQIEELFRKVWLEDAEEYPREWRKLRALTKKQIMQEMKEGYQYFGIRLENKLVGVYKAFLTPYGLFGEHQSVDPAHRKLGLATAMYRHFIAYAKQNRCRKVYVNILATQIASQKIVKKMGFHKVGPEYSQAEGMKVQIYCCKV